MPTTADSTLPTQQNEMTTDLGGACQLLLPCCPVAKRYTNKKQSAQISSTNGNHGDYCDGQEASGKDFFQTRNKQPLDIFCYP